MEMKLDKKWLIAALCFVGVIFLSLSFLSSKFFGPSIGNNTVLAKVESLEKEVWVLKKQNLERQLVSKKTSLYHLDTVETNSEGEALLDFPSSYRIKLLRNSQITLDQQNEKTYLIVKHGDLKIENFGKEGSIYISKSGQEWTATDYELYARGINQTPQTSPSTDNALPNPSTVDGKLSAELIQQTLNAHKHIFFKCYSQLLQKTPGIKGDASLTFTIEQTGKITDPHVTNSSFTDPIFVRCLTEAVERIEFRSFSGDPITTVFPLRFE